MFVHLPVQEMLLEKRQAQAVLGDKQARTCHEFPAVSCQQIPCDRHVQLKEDDEESGMLHSKTVQKHDNDAVTLQSVLLPDLICTANTAIEPWLWDAMVHNPRYPRCVVSSSHPWFLTSFIIHFWVTPKVDPLICALPRPPQIVGAADAGHSR